MHERKHAHLVCCYPRYTHSRPQSHLICFKNTHPPEPALNMSISISWPFPKGDHGLNVITYGIKAPCSRHAIGYCVITHNFKSEHCSNIFGIDFKVVYTTGKFEKN